MNPLQGSQAPVESRGTQRNSFVHAAARKQRGVALLVVLVALGLPVGMLAIGFAGDLVRQNQRQQRTTDALAQAREALIGRAVSDDNRPGSTLLTTQAVAVVFAPGSPIDGQTRSATLTALCPVTGTIIAQSRCASNYLESASGINNATASGPYISAPPAEISRQRCESA